MKNPYQPGDSQRIETRVTEEKLARFEGQVVHPVYSTFALGQDAEWACRQFVLQMTEEGEEGVGTFLSIYHASPALLGEAVHITATLAHVTGHTVHCTWEARVGERQIAYGEQTQRIVSKDRFAALLQSLHT